MSAERKTAEGDPVLAKIDSVRRTVISWSLLWGVLWLALAAGLLLFGGVLLDHAFVLQKWSRLAFFRAFLLVVAGGTLATVLFPLVRRMGRLYVARRMERERPELKNALISYLQCRGDPHTPAELKVLLGRKARRSIGSLDADVVVEREHYYRLGLVLAALAVLFLTYVLASPKSAAASLRRLLNPGAAILPPTSTRLAEVEPGDLYVIAGARPRLEVKVAGQRPPAVYALWNGESFEHRRVLLTERKDGRWEGAFPAILEDGNYHVVAGDTRSDRFRIEALPKPAVTELQVTVRPPAYTGLPNRTVTDADVEAVAGSQLHLRAATNLPARIGHLEFDSGQRVWLESAGPSALEGGFTATRSDAYRAYFETPQYPNGEVFRNDSPVRYRLTVDEDEAPRARIVAPPDDVEREAGARVEVGWEAEDDFRVTRVRLRYDVGDLHNPVVDVAEPEAGSQADGVWQWDLSETGVRPGGVIVYHLEAEDNHPGVPQVGRSETRRIRIKGKRSRPGQTQPRAEPQGEEETGQPPRESSPQETPQKKPLRQEPEGRRQQATRQERPEPREKSEAEQAEREESPPDTPRRDQSEKEEIERKLREAARRLSGEKTRGEPESDAPRTPEEPGPARPAPQQSPENQKAPQERRPESPVPRQEEPEQKKEGACAGGGQGETGSGSCAGSSPGAGTGGQGGGGSGQGRQGASGQGQADQTASGGKGSEGAGGGEGQAGTAAARGEKGAATPGQAGTQAAPGRAGSGAQGTGVRTLPRGGGREESLPEPRELDRSVEELSRMLEEGSLPPDFLDELQMNRKQLRRLIDRYRRMRREAGKPTEEDESPTPRPEEEGRVIERGGAAGKDMKASDAQPEKVKKDDLRSRFEGVADELSSRYRALADQYYKALSEER